MFTCRHTMIIEGLDTLSPAGCLPGLSVLLCSALLSFCLSVLCIPDPCPAGNVSINKVQYKAEVIGEVSRWNGTPATHGTIHELSMGPRLTPLSYSSYHYLFVKHAYFIEGYDGTQNVR
jgi:hypothetical protein